jgi:hypothetical protein
VSAGVAPTSRESEEVSSLRSLTRADFDALRERIEVLNKAYYSLLRLPIPFTLTNSITLRTTMLTLGSFLTGMQAFSQLS